MNIDQFATSHDVNLRFPVTVDAETYNSLTVRRATVGDQLRAMRHAKEEGASGIRLTALLTGVADDVIEALDALDFSEVQKVVSVFTGSDSEKKS